MTETEQARMQAEVPEKKKGPGIKAAYYNFLLKIKPKPVRIALSTAEAKVDMSQITTVPKLTEDSVDEVELLPVKQNYSYVRIRFDNRANESPTR